MALVDPSKLGRPYLNVLETLRSYEHGIVRQKNKLDDEKARYDKMKKEAETIVRDHLVKTAGVPEGHCKIEVKLSRPEPGENPDLRIVILVTKQHEVALINELRKKKLDFKVTPASEKRWGGSTRILIILHELLDRSEARDGGNMRPTR